MGQAHAGTPDESCPDHFPARPPASAGELAAEAGRLTGLEDACSRRGDYFAYQGVVLLMLRQTQPAANALEKALMLDPDLVGAQLDYAQALAELGELDTARRLARDVSRRPDTPPALKNWLSDRLSELGQTAWDVRWSAQWLTGKETNLNSAPSIQSLTLTLPGGDVTVALAANERRIPGSAWRVDVAGFASHALGDGQFLVNGEISTRRSPANDETNQRILGASATYLHPLLGGQLGIRLNGARLAVGRQDAYASNGWGLLVLLPENVSPFGCRTGLSRDHENRDFPVSPILAGVYTGNQIWSNCVTGDWQFNVGLQSGHDRAISADRLGGDQRRYDLVLGAGHPLGPGVLSVSGQRGRLLDRDAYSDLLGGQPRVVDRLGGRISYEYPLMKQLSIIGYYESTSQNSNVGLFDIKNKALYFGVKYRGQ